MISENYRKRLMEIAGIDEKTAFLNSDGQLANFSETGDYIPGSKEFKYSITYQKIDKSQFADGEDISDYTDQGYEIEPVLSRLSFIIENAKDNFGIYEPSSSPVSEGCWWSSTSPENSREYIEKGLEKYYSLHIKKLDGSNLTKEESEFITKLLNPSTRTYWDDMDNKWTGGIN